MELLPLSRHIAALSALVVNTAPPALALRFLFLSKRCPHSLHKAQLPPPPNTLLGERLPAAQRLQQVQLSYASRSGVQVLLNEKTHLLDIP